MHEWKMRQEIFHRLKTTYTDDLSDKKIEMSKNIAVDAVRYFQEQDIGWLYPAKSYMVGICYARWLARHFGGEPIDYLEDSDLLFGNDPHFVQYSADPETYHKILNIIGGWQFSEDQGMVPDVYCYFLEEFMLDE